MTWLRALKETARAGLTVERKRLEPLVALRGAAGLAVVIGLSLTLFGPAVAASSAFGAFQAAIATFQRSWRPRPELALASGTSLAVSTFLGYLTGSHLLLFLALLCLWTFLAGLSWAAGPTVGIIASSNVAIMLVTVTIPTSVAAAAGHAAMMIVGGCVQAALVILFPVRRWGAHRDALADALAAEADYARRLRHDPVAAFDPEPLMAARDAATITARQARTRPAELHGARGVAERIRPVLASLADPAVGVPAEGKERDRVRELLGAAGAVLDAAARAIRHGDPVKIPPEAQAALRTPDTGAILTGPAYRAATRLGALLKDVLETAGNTNSPTTEPPSTEPTSTEPNSTEPAPSKSAPSGPAPEASAPAETAMAEPTSPGPASTEAIPAAPNPTPPAPASPASRGQASTEPTPAAPTPTPPTPLLRPTLFALVPAAVRAVRGELRHESPVTRHAIRVTAVAAAGYLFGHLLPLGHGYWAPMASVMVMRPDFSQTYSRAVARFGGTLVGVALATGLVQLAHPGTGLSAALAVLCAGMMYLLMRTGQVAAQACVAAYVVFLLGMGGQQWTQTVPERVVLTLLGGVLAMIAYALYPAWETPRLRTRLADWLVADGRYAAAVVDRYAHPAGKACPDVREALLAARDARVAWQEAVDRAKNEPVRHRGLSRAAAADAEEVLAQLGRVAMLMEAHLPERGDTPVPAAARLAEALRKSTEQGAKALRERRVPKWEAVRTALEEWDGEGVPDRVVRRGAGLLLETLDELSDALDTTPPPMLVDGTATKRPDADGPRNPEGPAAR
ncbi:FUSC family protein [Streptomyces sp. Je 1-369]|uniref:FUSC family protein n=1 Tax=Streptomyces sp. Je 1-369 TaxID=2966192 RepID=UPI002285A6C3|nr:FUSC family protein [Streptomyces sp. Je 1-369]WAL96981.1 FUSC family protein [Streptomyces sp. Je 1-369]